MSGSKKLSSRDKRAIKAGHAAAKKPKAAPAEPAAAPVPREIVGWRPGQTFDPAETVGLMKVVDLIAAVAKDNPREWSASALSVLARSIERVGLLNYPVFNRRTKRLIAGHMRVAAIAKKLKWDQVPVRFENMDAETEELARVQDNNRAGQGRWTDDVADQLKAIEARDREAFVQLGLENILEQLANQDPGEVQTSDGKDRGEQGDSEGWVNITYRIPAGFALALKAKVQETINRRGLVGKSAKGQALEILVANGDPAHKCATELDIRKAVDRAILEAAAGRRTLPKAIEAEATLAQLGDQAVPFTDGE